MFRLRFCALATFVITSSAALAVGQDGQTLPAQAALATEQIAEIGAIVNVEDPVMTLPLGTAKTSAPCGSICILSRPADPHLATVGEREVAAAMAKAATTMPRLHVDRTRLAALQTGKIPRGALAPQALIVPTRNAFRPALDPVLAEPGTDSNE